MKKVLFVMMFLLVLVVLPGAANAASDDTCEVLVNGDESGMVAYVQDGVSFLPLRELAELFFLDIDWDNAEKCATVTMRFANGDIVDTNKMYLGDKKYYVPRANGTVDSYDLDAAPLVRNGRVYLPLRFMSELCEGRVDWNEETGKIEVYCLQFKNGSWNTDIGDGRDIKARGEDDTIYTAARIGEPTMGHDNLWALYPDGRAERLNSAWIIPEVKVDDDTVYYLSWQMGFGEQYRIYAVDLNTKETAWLGDPEFIYNTPIVDKGIYVLGSGKDLADPWQVTEDGVLAIGFSGEALADDVVEDVELARETYGLWLLDKDGKGQTLVKQLSFESDNEANSDADAAA